MPRVPSVGPPQFDVILVGLGGSALLAGAGDIPVLQGPGFMTSLSSMDVGWGFFNRSWALAGTDTGT